MENKTEFLTGVSEVRPLKFDYTDFSEDVQLTEKELAEFNYSHAKQNNYTRLTELRLNIPYVEINKIPDKTFLFSLAASESGNINLPQDASLMVITCSAPQSLAWSVMGQIGAVVQLQASLNGATDYLSQGMVNYTNKLFSCVGINSLGLLNLDSVNSITVSVSCWLNVE